MARDLAVKTTRITLADCIPNPLVIQVRLQDKITIKNNDAVDHVIRRAFLPLVQISAHSTKSASVKDMFKETGIFGYSCSGAAGISGVVLVIP